MGIKSNTDQIKNVNEQAESNTNQIKNVGEQTENIKNSLDTMSKTIATLTQKIEDLDNNKVSYNSPIKIGSSKGGKITDIQNGYARFQNDLNPNPNENETMDLEIIE